jgi:hypothetical protein
MEIPLRRPRLLQAARRQPTCDPPSIRHIVMPSTPGDRTPNGGRPSFDQSDRRRKQNQNGLSCGYPLNNSTIVIALAP